MSVPILSTARLVLRPLDLSDADEIQRVFPQWEIVRFLFAGVPWPYPSNGALIYLRDRALPAMQAGSEWHWSIRLKASPCPPIGVVSLMDKENENRGFWLDPKWQGNGLMTEASNAVTTYWFEVIGKPALRVPKAIANIRSRRISERSDMRVIGMEEREYVSGRFLAEIWEITAGEWQRHIGYPPLVR